MRTTETRLEIGQKATPSHKLLPYKHTGLKELGLLSTLIARPEKGEEPTVSAMTENETRFIAVLGSFSRTEEGDRLFDAKIKSHNHIIYVWKIVG
jgi:hypothetical protein